MRHVRTDADQDRLFADLTKAMRMRRPVAITYTRANGSETVRSIEPFMITRNKDGDRYVRAMDRQSKESRTFRLDRIKAYTVGGHKSRFLLEHPETDKPSREVPTQAEIKRARQYAAADRPTPETIRQASGAVVRVYPTIQLTESAMTGAR